MGEFSGYKPVLAMIGLQCIYTGYALFTRAALLQGMSPRVFVVYRQSVATLIMAPIAYFTRWKNPYRTSLGLRSFSLIFVASLFGATAHQNAYFEGLYLSSPTIATAMTNLLPAVTFVMATIVRLEKVNVQSLRSIAKIIGTVFSVGGAICMALVKGPKLLNTEFLPSKSVLSGIMGVENLQLGCIFLFISCFCWSFWMIMQVPISASCPDHLIQLFGLWHLHSYLELGSCLYAGIGTAVSFLVQAWCIPLRGPLFASMFSPLCTVITTIVASLFLHEKLYTGSLLGAFTVIIGLYIVLWGKAKDLEDIKSDIQDDPELQFDQRKIVKVLTDQSPEKVNTSCRNDLEESFLPDKSNYAN
ncbi:Plant-drug/metabolite exporter [Trema orientale]|uniref:WAT1-related protein n=1 Tax=Trema orientale TaxID=63057 RepID=A0A2P5DIJ6_TREOI|nr:Plant-drug/metabolite exporter [Trema orientale]